jgi:hypothetical protein
MGWGTKKAVLKEVAKREGLKSQAKFGDLTEGVTRLQEMQAEAEFEGHEVTPFDALRAGVDKHKAKLQKAYDKAHKNDPKPVPVTEKPEGEIVDASGGSVDDVPASEEIQ